MRLFAMATVAALALAACSGSDDGPRPDGSATAVGTGLASPGEGSLIVSNLGQIVERDIESGAVRVMLTASEPNSFLLDAAASPDGTQIAYIRQPPPSIIDGRFDGGSDLWVANRDGSGARPLFEHVQPNQLVRFPRWLDATSVLAIVQEISQVEEVTRVVYTLQRFDVSTGERTRLLDDVLSFDVFPGGERVVYANLLPETGEVLSASGLDGAGDAELVGLDQLLAPFGFPRVSPDGTQVAFASADQTGARNRGVEFVALAGPANGPLPSAAFLDGLPQDVWTVPKDGGTAVRVADLKEDLPALTWDGSGRHIYAIGNQGLYDINLETGGVSVIGEGAYHAQISWAPDVP